MQKYAAIWQSHTPQERDWIEEVLGPYICEHVTDSKHQIVRDNAILLDAFTFCHDAAYYARFRRRNAFLVHFLDENYAGGYEVYNNFRGVLRCFWSNTFDAGRVMKMPLGYCNGRGRSGRPIKSASARKYLWSFAGQLQKSSRPDMARALAGIEPHFLCATDALKSPHEENRPLGPSEYADLLFESAFSPCPMGNANLECFRVYESLECGSIPIVEKRWTLDYFKNLLGDHPLPTVRSWPEAGRLIRRMAEDSAQLNALQKRCITWWESYKRRYSAEVGEFLRVRSADAAPWETSPTSLTQKLPGWSYLELARHHDAAALLRRVRKQMSRLRRGENLRVAFRPGAKLD